MTKFNEAVAHISPDGRIQNVREHNENVAKLAAEFAKEFGAESKGYLAGIFHDIGKYSPDFQKHITYNDNSLVDHSTAGAVEIAKLDLYDIALAIAGHHTGIPELGTRFDDSNEPTLKGRFKRKLCDYELFKSYIDERKLNKLLSKAKTEGECDNNYSFMFFVRMLFSCLVDADYLDTEAFMTGKRRDYGYDSIESLNDIFDKYACNLIKNPSGAINNARCEMLNECVASGNTFSHGIYRMALPTGAGKTLDSMAFALKSAIKNGHKRIIYVIPYMSIIDQTADTYQNIFGSNNVIEHHSSVEYKDDNEIDHNKMLAAENWDAPIIITTAVQFFESLYSYKPAKCRKLHNIANSVIIFDEAQTIPTNYLDPCVRSLYELYSKYNCTIVLSTATQPPFERVFQKFGLLNIPIRDICNVPLKYVSLFNRCVIKNVGKLTEEELLSKVKSNKCALVIFNTKKTARRFYSKLNGKNKLLLTTDLTSYDRKRIIQQVKEYIANGRSFYVIATSLVEAGVDLDFPAVFREFCGVDSIIQSAGRCNREGKLPWTESITAYFELTDSIAWTGIAQNISASKIALKNCQVNAAAADYFSALWSISGEFTDAKKILKTTQKNTLPFRKIGDEFNLINDNTITIYIPCENNTKLIQELKSTEIVSCKLIRKLSQFSVSVYRNTFDSLMRNGALETVKDTYFILSDETYYSKETGLHNPYEQSEAIIF